jgi:hypothetical protein
MSVKSERKRAVKAQKQAEAVAQALTQSAPPPPRKWYAEDIAEQLQEHRAHCTDPNCDESAIGLAWPGVKIVAILYPHNFNEIFLAPVGTADYKPFASLQLANAGDIAGMFNPDGSLPCDNPYCPVHTKDEPTCLTMTCHHEGLGLAFEHDGTVSLRCKVCKKVMRHSKMADSFKLAPRPKAEFPNLFCRTHGIEPGYIACIHILEDGAPPALMFRVDTEHYGEAYCDECAELYKIHEEESARKVADRSHRVCQSSLNKALDGKLNEWLEALCA